MATFALSGINRDFRSLEPDGWRFLGVWDDQPVAGWKVDGPSEFKQSLAAGSVQEGVQIRSQGIPRIVKFLVQGFRPTRHLGLADLNPVGARESFRNDFFNNSFIGTTIGPADPPSPFFPSDFLDTLISYKHQSVALGWLTSHRDDDCDDDERSEDGIIKNLDKRLEKAKKELIQRDSVKARRELEKFVKKVERIWKRSQDQDKKRGRDKDGDRAGSVMTSEAYALLKYNAEYLIERLPDREKPVREKDKGKPKDRSRD
jgi:hypothetical protein